MHEYHRYSCMKGRFMCKRVTIILQLSFILLTMCAGLFTESKVAVNQWFNDSRGSIMTTSRTRKIKTVTMRAENHQELKKAQNGSKEDDLLFDPDSPDYDILWTGRVESGAHGIRTGYFQRISTYPTRIWHRSIIRC